ncbi:MAG TPA: DUF2059 domain-containing protein [Longimicrobium sp.]|nr:DUF2059 domain-containing protein [Longimicrobium sp.]
MKLLPVALALALTLAAGGARAQSSAEQRAAATELLVAMQAPQVMQGAIQATLDAQLRATPELQGVQDVVREFVARYVSWEALREQYVEIYAQAFTEDELRQMTDFYRSEVGQKLARSTPRLMAQGAALGERAVQDHRAELQRMILARLRATSPAQPAATPATATPTTPAARPSATPTSPAPPAPAPAPRP